MFDKYEYITVCLNNEIVQSLFICLNFVQTNLIWFIIGQHQVYSILDFLFLDLPRLAQLVVANNSIQVQN